MSELLFNKVTVESSKKNKGVEFTDAEKKIVRQVILDKIEEFGGVPTKTIGGKEGPDGVIKGGKEVVDGGKFAPAIKKACLEAGEVPDIYEGVGRSWSSYAYLAGAVVRELVAEATKAKAKKAKEDAAAVTDKVA